MPIIGLDKHLNRLKRLSSPQLGDVIGKAIFVAADDIKAEAQRSITAGSVSGRNHVASKPGEPPNNDTGNLKARIVAVKTGPLKAEVRAEAPYSAALEFGTSKMAARPYMRPARDKIAPTLSGIVAREVSKIVRGSG